MGAVLRPVLEIRDLPDESNDLLPREDRGQAWRGEERNQSGNEKQQAALGALPVAMLLALNAETTLQVDRSGC